MEIVMWVSRYLMCGLVVSFIMDMLNKNNPDPDMRFTNKERLIIIVWWPITLLAFVYHFLRSWF